MVEETDASKQPTTRRKFLKKLIGIEGEGPQAPLSDTAKLSIYWINGVILATAALNVLQKSGTVDVSTGNRGAPEISQELRERTPQALIKDCLEFPFLEETFFRGLPNIALLLTKRTGIYWRVGLPTALAFAAAHNLDRDQQRNLFLATDTLPIQQFASGLFFWKILRERGYLHSVAAHMIFNTYAIGLGFIAAKK